MGYTRCFQWRPVNTLQKGGIYKSTQGSSTTTWHYQWGRRIWSRRNQRTLQKRKRHLISSALERIWKQTWLIDGRNKLITHKRGNSRLLDTTFKTIKERAKGYFSTSWMHTSTRETLLNMSSFTNAATNASTTAASLTWNQETYNKIMHCNNKTKD